MTKEQRKKIKRLIELRKKAGERLMVYDGELEKAFGEVGVDFASCECGLNSVFLITEPDYCKDQALKLLCEIEKGGEG